LATEPNQFSLKKHPTSTRILPDVDNDSPEFNMLHNVMSGLKKVDILNVGLNFTKGIVLIHFIRLIWKGVYED
jgi:hypothetical protein